MPAEGGEPRLMNCNTESMNSWHSWSPNSRWLVFSSKLFSPYTQLFITHIDEDGNDTPPVLLKNFIIPERAANIPEFVNIEPDAARTIHERFVDDYNFLRRGRRLEEFGRVEDARDQYLASLELNPESTEARLALGLSYAVRGDLDEAEREFKAVLEQNPRHGRALYALGGLYADRGDHSAAVAEYEKSLGAGPHEPYFEANVHLNLGRCLAELEQYDRAIREIGRVLALDPESLDAHIHLGNIHLRLGDIDSAIAEFEAALEIDPSMDSLKEKVEELRAILSTS
jgi:tetratricopeptide (TPR) repeat protein